MGKARRAGRHYCDFGTLSEEPRGETAQVYGRLEGASAVETKLRSGYESARNAEGSRRAEQRLWLITEQEYKDRLRSCAAEQFEVEWQ